MSIRHRIYLIVFALALVPGVAWAAELTTEAERTYRDLQRSKVAKDQLLADRWYNLIRQQEWDDASGKHTTVAKYVDHDPDLQWVKLRVIRGTGANRVVKDVEIPLARLSKTCQSRVRQIARLKDRVAGAAVEAAKKPETDDAIEETRATAVPGGERGTGVPPTDNPPAVAEQSASSPPAPDVAPRPPLPALLPPLPASTTEVAARPIGALSPGQSTNRESATPTAAGDGRPTTEMEPNGAVEPARLPDSAPWRTSYDAFRANIRSVDGGRLGPQVDWGELESLKEAHDIAVNFGDSPESETRQIQEKLAEIGEFVWEATLTDAEIEEDGEWTARLGLPAQAGPIEIHFLLDEGFGKQPGNWQRLKAGDRVRFIGRFLDFETSDMLLVGIRFPAQSGVEGHQAR